MPFHPDYGWYDDGTVTAPTWESSAGGDYRRRGRMVDNGINLGFFFSPDYTPSMGVRSDAGPNYYGGAGAAHQYDYQKKNSDGTWSYVNPGEHNEEASYFWAGVNSPQYVQALQKSAEQQTALDKARLASPAAVGMAATRSEASLTGGSNEDDLRQELAHYTAMNPSLLGGIAEAQTPQMQAAIQQQLKDSSAEAQSARAEASSGGFGDLIPIAILIGVGIATGGFGLAGAGAEAGAAAAGVTTGEMAGLAAADAAAGLIPAQTGGWLVGSEGLIGSTGNMIGDTVLNSAGQNALTSAVRGGDPLEGALKGAAGGLISSSGVLNGVSSAITPDGASGVAANAIQKGVNAAGQAVVTGGDPLAAGLASAGGNYVGGTVAETGAPRAISGAVGGGTAGLIGAGVAGTDIGNSVLTGLAAGGAGGLASDLGASNSNANAIGSVVGGLVGSELADDQTTAGPAPAGGATTPVTPAFAGATFADMLPPEFVDVTRTTEWGSRLKTAGRI